MLHGVGRKFLKGHGEGQGHARRQAGGRAVDVNTVFASTAVGLNCLGNNLRKIGGFPILSREHVVSESQRTKAVLDSDLGVFRGWRIAKRLERN
jgi:hypothetical protein